ncbi:MAG: endo alpha-1,4 polygalactosaminidase [Gammaproteobacteria bacterium]|nr:endo alpha-1,4 polygalactosaminidase [Gammaproteobacteria bacterium]
MDMMLRVKEAVYILMLSVIGNLHLTSTARAAEQLSPWMVYYGANASAKVFEPYKLVILDGENHSLAARLVDRGKTVLAYLSLGEVEKNRHWFAAVKAEGLLLMENRNWPGSFYLDVRDNRWQSRVIEELIPGLLQRGFDGIFLDTLDNPAELERKDAKKYRGMTDAAARLVLTIRRHYPEIKIMMNRGYEILPRVGAAIDMQLGESVFSTYHFKTGRYGFVDTQDYQLQLKWLQNAAKKFPRLDIYTLDYWNPEDTEGIARLYEEEYRNGFIPLVSTIALDQIVAEPAGIKRQ